MRRVSVVFEGHVQGVGFRFTTVRVAASFAVTGYVRNNPDGTVRLVAEGDESDLLAFLNAVRTSVVGRYVRNETVEWRSASGEYDTFDVQYGG